MNCPKCGSDKVNVQMVSETKLKRKRGIIYKLLIGWWVNLILWIFMALPMLVYRLFAPKRYKMKTIHKSMAVCQSCGNSWQV